MAGSNFYQDQIMAEIYREERLREAETARLIRQIQAQKPKHPKYINTALLWLGKRLILWGTRLQERCSPTFQLNREPREATG